MGRSQETFNKKEREKKKEKKRKEKAEKRLAKKDNDKSTSFDDMIAYVDEFGNITSTPPDPAGKKKVKAEDIEVSIPKKGSEPEDTTRRGKVKYFDHSKGYGFIKDLETQDSIFVHINNILDEVKEGDLVTFEIGNGPKGPNAFEVKLEK
ncbi:MAG: cold shock domain-containing protein [Bacteroidales bacterium]|nr:cold shock domain-containing protein [Bacteroidales bacterium]MBN2818692.1 cold shock domain-containing protein [Bacteroidales bacterium]